MSLNLIHKTDAELYQLMGEKDQISKSAFDEIYRRYSAKVYTYCKKITGYHDSANDIFQETFTRLYEHRFNQQDMKNLQGYLIKIARNLHLSSQERNHTKNSVSIEDVILVHYDENYEHKQLIDVLEAAVESLPLEFKEVLIMKEYMNLSYNDISEALEVNLSVVRTRIFRAKTKIKELLAPYLNELSKIN